MGQIRNRERRWNQSKYYGVERRKKSSLILRLLGINNMCDRASICPEFERRTINGIISPCEMCEYLKQEKKKLKKIRIMTICVFIVFLITTYFKYNI